MTGDRFISLDKVIDRITSAYRFIDITPRYYVTRVLLPALVTGVVGLVGVSVLFGGLFTLVAGVIAGAGVILLALYPLAKYSTHKNKLNSEFPLFITHITALSLSNADRVEIFRQIAQSDEYTAISEEVRRFVSQIDNLNTSIDDAANVRSNQTPSEIMSDFYEKLSYSVGAGQPLSEFLQEEQEEYISSYSTDYEFRLKRIEYITNLFVGISTSFAFVFVTLLVMPFLTSIDIVTVIIPTVVIYLLIQSVFIVVINTVTPRDKLWYWSDEVTTKKERNIKLSLGGSILAVWLISLLLFVYQPGFSIYFYPILATVPLLLPSYIIFVSEREIIRDEEQFGSFIRSLGNIENVKQTSTQQVLSTLKQKNYGSLNKHIEELNNRLYTNIDPEKAWTLFSANIGSNLIRTFSHMYYIGRTMGSDTDILGDIINKNFNHIKSLRKSRSAVVSQFTGNIYGTGLALSVSLFMSIEIIEIIAEQIEEVPTEEVPTLAQPIYNFDFIYVTLFAVIILNGFLIGLLIRIAQRRYIGGLVFHMFLYILISFLIGYGVDYMFNVFFDF